MMKRLGFSRQGRSRRVAASTAAGQVASPSAHHGYAVPDDLLFFDAAWYLARNDDVREAGVDPREHFLARGLLEGRDPHPLFDTVWYVGQNPDVAAAAVPPYWHFARHGVIEGRDPHPLFATAWYAARNPDVAAVGELPFRHYMAHGAAEGRSPHPLFDALFYRHRHRRDPAAVSHPLAHYLAHGRQSGFDPNGFFDNGWYHSCHGAGSMSALEDYVLRGEALGLAPHPLWDDETYLDVNLHLRRAGVAPYRHFVEFGASEIEAGKYRIFRFAWGDLALDYDPAAYLLDNPDVAVAIREGRVRSGLEHLFAIGYREAAEGLRAIYGPGHRPALVRSVEGGAGWTGRHLCIFAHYDRDQVIDPYILPYLAALRAADVDLVFVTATHEAGELDKIIPLVSSVLVKTDRARDFGSWWLALRHLPAERMAGYDRVIWANDSIYFPVAPPEPMFADLTAKGLNLYGLSDSLDFDSYHVQSFFLCFDARARSAIFPWFMARFEQCYVLTKAGQIREFELGITRQAVAAGLSFGAFYSVDDGREEAYRVADLKPWAEAFRSSSLNPSHDLWDVLIQRYGWPALKLELVRDNPRQVPGLQTLRSVIAGGTVGYDVIMRHQARLRRPAQRRASPLASTGKGVELAVREQIGGQGRAAAKRLVLFAHYDPDGIVDDHIVYQVRKLEEAGCAIAFITPTDRARELDKVRGHVRDIIVKTDTGRDFGSWSLALRPGLLALAEFETVIWMNDSTYFPLFDLGAMFAAMERRDLDFWGIVDSYNRDWHVMSWFWAFGPRAIRDGWFDWYRREYNPRHSKWNQIYNYEMRLPRLIQASGLTTGVYISARDVQATILRDYVGHPLTDVASFGRFTMTHDFWEEIIRDFRCPALKVELVRDNPLGRDLSSLLAVIRTRTEFPADLIANHLRRLQAKHLPLVTLDSFRCKAPL